MLLSVGVSFVCEEEWFLSRNTSQNCRKDVSEGAGTRDGGHGKDAEVHGGRFVVVGDGV